MGRHTVAKPGEDEFAAGRRLDFSLHPGQMLVWKSPARFRVIVAGRRWGKSRLAAMLLLKEGLENTDPTKHVFYVAPTFQQAKDVLWQVLMEIGRPVIKSVRSNEAQIQLVNDVWVHLKGSDRPETLRGVGLKFVAIDEYADMKPDVWELIIRPALADVRGRAVFIGTPKGRNHFWKLVKAAESLPDWEVFRFKSRTNPFLPKDEVEAARGTMSSMAFRQEFEASFEAGGSDLFKPNWLKFGPEPDDGTYYVSVDCAGFADAQKAKVLKNSNLDRSAIAVVKVGEKGWWVKEIQVGRWDIRETSLRILQAARRSGAQVVGIEKGMARNAILPYLTEQMRRLNTFPLLVETTHGNKHKTERIVWSLQGRFEHGRLVLNQDGVDEDGGWQDQFIDEYKNFPSEQVHDDMMDALAYIDQVSIQVFHEDADQPEFTPLDPVTGY